MANKDPKVNGIANFEGLMIIIGREKRETKKQNMDRPTMTIKAVYLCSLPIPQKSSD
jgi:hypothetical protein